MFYPKMCYNKHCFKEVCMHLYTLQPFLVLLNHSGLDSSGLNWSTNPGVQWSLTLLAHVFNKYDRRQWVIYDLKDKNCPVKFYQHGEVVAIKCSSFPTNGWAHSFKALLGIIGTSCQVTDLNTIPDMLTRGHLGINTLVIVGLAVYEMATICFRG